MLWKWCVWISLWKQKCCIVQFLLKKNKTLIIVQGGDILCSYVHTLHCTWSLLHGQYFICTWRMYFFLLCVLKKETLLKIYLIYIIKDLRLCVCCKSFDVYWVLVYTLHHSHRSADLCTGHCSLYCDLSPGEMWYFFSSASHSSLMTVFIHEINILSKTRRWRSWNVGTNAF